MNIFVRPPYQKKGIGRHSVKSLMKSFEDFGADKVVMHPAFDGLNTWAKINEFNLIGKNKERFLKKYKEYTKKRNIKFKDLGDNPTSYPEDFLKRVENATFVPFRYSKILKKKANMKFYEKLMEKKSAGGYVSAAVRGAWGVGSRIMIPATVVGGTYGLATGSKGKRKEKGLKKFKKGLSAELVGGGALGELAGIANLRRLRKLV